MGHAIRPDRGSVTELDSSDKHAEPTARALAASLALASVASTADELREVLDMLGLPPCERPIRLSERYLKDDPE